MTFIMVQASAVVHTGASSRTDESGTFSIATWNIRSGRAGGLESACRALGALNVDIGFLQETELTGGVYTRQSSGYQVIASDASSNRQGGVALCWKEHDSYELEEWRFFGPNVLAFRLVTGGKDFYCVGCYIPPSEEDQSTLENVRRAQQQCPEKFELLLFGDLNIDLDAPRDTREEIIAEQCDFWKLTCMTTMFKQRRTRRVKGRWTWRQQRLGRWVSTKPDYLLADTAVRRLFKKVVIRRPRHHDSDHRAIIATFWGGQEKRMRNYRRRVASIPLRMPQFGPLPEMETIFEELKEEVGGKSKRDLPHNQWISDRTWALVDYRAMLKTRGSLQQRGERNLSRRINASFRQDRMARAENAAVEIETKLNGGDFKAGWTIAKRWYRAATDRGPKPCFETMETQTTERVELYGKVEPPGEPIPINVQPFGICDGTPDDEEIRDVVKYHLKSGRAGGASFLRAEDIKRWLRDIEQEEDPERSGGCGRNWRRFVSLIQMIWETGTVPKQMLWVIVVLIPKGGGDYRGIGLLEPFWKVVEIIMDKRLNEVKFHDCLHGFVTKRGCGTAGLEAKLTQQLAYIRQIPLYGIFLDLRKAYDAVDRERCLEILQGYGVGRNMLHLLEYFWNNAELVCRAMGRYGKPFKAYRGVTQGGPVSPKIFNIMVDAIVREWLLQSLGEMEPDMPEYKALSCIFLALFYADDSCRQTQSCYRNRWTYSLHFLSE